MDHTLAIDFGTSNSTVYVYKNNSFEALTDETGSSLFECARTVNGVTGAVCQHERGTEGLAAWDGSREGGRTTV